MRVLLTGVTGSIGTSLAPRLLRDGHAVRGLSRRAVDEIPSGAVPADVEMVRGDVLAGSGLAAAFAGIEVAYYLVHSMEPSPTDDLAAREQQAASNFAKAAAEAGVGRIIYLGGLVPEPAGPVDGSLHPDGSGQPATGGISRHLLSRLEVERRLLAAAPRSTAFRASIVIGARSRSFRLLVRLVERMPVILLPAWGERRTAPVDERDVIECLARVASTGELQGRSVDIAGAETVTYGALIERIRDLLLLDRPVLNVPVTVTPIASRLASLVANEQHALVGPLMEGLSADLLPRSPDAMDLLSLRRHTLDAAIEHALGEWEATDPLSGR